MRVTRYDTVRLDKAEPTENGGLRIPAYPTRAGVLVYRTPDGKTIRELRPPEEVFHADSLASLRGKPVTDLHPGEGRVTANTWKGLATGHVGDAIAPDGDKVAATVYVQDAAMVRAIQAKERTELSCGYQADVDETPGVYNGQPYDRVQKNIRYDHVGIGPNGWGRAGPDCRLRLDGTDAVRVEGNMLKIDGKDYADGSAECQAAITALEKGRDTAKGELAVATANAAALKVKLDAADDPKRITALVAERVRLVADIQRGNRHYLDAAGDPPAEPDGGSDPIALMSEALMTWQPSLDLKGASPDMVMGAFKAMMAAVGAAEPPADAPLDAKPEPLANVRPTEMQMNGGGLRALAGKSNKLDDARAAVNGKGTRHDAGDVDPRDAMIEYNRTLATGK